MARLFQITGVSANQKTTKCMERRDTDEQKIVLLGGMMKVGAYFFYDVDISPSGQHSCGSLRVGEIKTRWRKN